MRAHEYIWISDHLSVQRGRTIIGVGDSDQGKRMKAEAAGPAVILMPDCAPTACLGFCKDLDEEWRMGEWENDW